MKQCFIPNPTARKWCCKDGPNSVRLNKAGRKERKPGLAAQGQRKLKGFKKVTRLEGGHGRQKEEQMQTLSQE